LALRIKGNVVASSDHAQGKIGGGKRIITFMGKVGKAKEGRGLRDRPFGKKTEKIQDVRREK
jgi:hypothetical protein